MAASLTGAIGQDGADASGAHLGEGDLLREGDQAP